jgi:hypothetical protein
MVPLIFWDRRAGRHDVAALQQAIRKMGGIQLLLAEAVTMRQRLWSPIRVAAMIPSCRFVAAVAKDSEGAPRETMYAAAYR